MSPRATPRTDHTHVLLLRGVNVGRSHRVAREVLVAWAEESGGEAVTTHLASGNVLFRAPADADAARVRDRFRTLAQEHGLDVPVVLVSVGMLREALVLHDGLDWAGGEPKLTQLTVLEDEPGPDAAERLAAADHGAERPVGPDRTLLRGRLLWMRCPASIADSPLTPARLDRVLGVRGTARNLTTVRVLAGLPAQC